jgi:hypothetical protein
VHGEFFMDTWKKWSFCNVYPSPEQTKTIFSDTYTQKNSREQKKPLQPSSGYSCIRLQAKEITALESVWYQCITLCSSLRYSTYNIHSGQEHHILQDFFELELVSKLRKGILSYIHASATLP